MNETRCHVPSALCSTHRGSHIGIYDVYKDVTTHVVRPATAEPETPRVSERGSQISNEVDKLMCKCRRRHVMRAEREGIIE